MNDLKIEILFDDNLQQDVSLASCCCCCSN